MNERLIIAALVGGLALLGAGAAQAAADGNCGSAASAPAVPGTANEAEPRSCDNGSDQQGPAAEPPSPEPPDGSGLPQPSAPADMPDEIPEPPPQQ